MQRQVHFWTYFHIQKMSNLHKVTPQILGLNVQYYIYIIGTRYFVTTVIQ
jgi:hypothetical protein